MKSVATFGSSSDVQAFPVTTPYFLGQGVVPDMHGPQSSDIGSQEFAFQEHLRSSTARVGTLVYKSHIFCER